MNSEEQSRQEEIRRRFVIVKAMDFLAHRVNDCTITDYWLECGVPDGTSDEELLSLIADDETYEYWGRVFLRTMRLKKPYQDFFAVRESAEGEEE